MNAREAWEFASFVVTTLGLPFAIMLFAWQERKERDNEEEEAYQLLSDACNDFLKVVLAHPGLHLRTKEPQSDPTAEPQSQSYLRRIKNAAPLFNRAERS